MRAVITGGAGFIGSHLADLLVARGDSVTLLDDLSTGRHTNVEHLTADGGAELVVGSILDDDLVDETFAGADVVFHLAAAVGVDLIVERPLDSLRTNIAGSEVVVAAAHRQGTRLVVTSSSEIYGKNASGRLHEDDDRILGSPLKSRWSYSEAKAIEEILAYTYWREKGLRSVIVRLFNTVGPRQTGTYGMVLPRFVARAVRGEPLEVYGDGAQTRCFCHVSDVVSAIADLSDHPEAFGRVFNIGSTEEISVADLAQRVVDRAGSESKVRFVPYEEAYEAGFEDMPRRVPDTGRVEALLGWSPTRRLDQIIDELLEGHRS